MTDWDEIRTHFPALEGRVYLNTAGGGPICREAAERVHQYYDELCREGDTKWNACLDRVEHTRQKLAGLLGAALAHPDYTGRALEVARNRVIQGPLGDALECAPLLGTGEALALPDNVEARARMEILIWEAGAQALQLPMLGKWVWGSEETFDALVAVARKPS